jgi:uncharacterized OB-fold protein
LEQRRCRECDRRFSLEYAICPDCGAQDYLREALSTSGRILTFFVQYYLPEEFDPPVPLAIVETADGGRLFGEVLAAPERVEIDLEVEVVLRSQQDDPNHAIYIPTFRPTGESEGD